MGGIFCEYLMIEISVELPLLRVIFFAPVTIAIRINKRYISNSTPNIKCFKDTHA